MQQIEHMSPKGRNNPNARAVNDVKLPRLPVQQWISRRQKTYILLSHVLGLNLPSSRPILRSYLEQAMAEVLCDGLYSPLHIKTIKRLTGAKSLGTSALSFLELLLANASALLQGRAVVLVIDDISGLSSAEMRQADRLLINLREAGFKVLHKQSDSALAHWQPLTAGKRRSSSSPTKESAPLS